MGPLHRDRRGPATATSLLLLIGATAAAAALLLLSPLLLVSTLLPSPLPVKRLSWRSIRRLVRLRSFDRGVISSSLASEPLNVVHCCMWLPC